MAGGLGAAGAQGGYACEGGDQPGCFPLHLKLLWNWKQSSVWKAALADLCRNRGGIMAAGRWMVKNHLGFVYGI
jgi:hypothetical protein